VEGKTHIEGTIAPFRRQDPAAGDGRNGSAVVERGLVVRPEDRPPLPFRE